MRGWLLPVGIGLALGLLVVVGMLAVGATASPTPAERTAALAAELRCPDCQGLSVADSPTRSAQEMRSRIDELIAGGATDEEVRAHFTARYGEWIRLAPSAPLAWLVPFVVVVAGVGLFLTWLTRRPQRPDATAVPGLDAEERRRLREEAEALDA